MPALLSVDLGTEGARVGAFDVEGRLLGTARHDYPTRFPRPGWAEQDPQSWWDATVASVRQVLSAELVRAAGPVAALAVATTASTVAVLDRRGVPLRPALLWMDNRASDEARLTGELADRHPVLAWSGGGDAVEWLVPKAMWLSRHEPETYAAAEHVVEAVDYLTHRLTGRWTGSRMNATCKWNYDPLAGVLPLALYADLGVPDLADKLPHDIRPVGAPAGTLVADAARELGIDGAPVVATGGIDAHISLVGCGACTPGLVSLVSGTSTVFVTEVPQPVFTPTVWGPYPQALRDGQWLVEGGQVSSGSVLRWMAEDVLQLPRGSTDRLFAEAAEVQPEEHGLLVLDYFMGNRTPHRDARLRGAVLGLTLSTTAAELYRAAVEGVAYGTRSVLDSFLAAGVPVERVVLSGGVRHNPLWLRTTADVLGRQLEVVASDNLSLRAGAAIAAVAAGTAPDLAAAACAFAPTTTVLEPDLTHRDTYEAGYALYASATALARPVLHQLADATGPRAS